VTTELAARLPPARPARLWHAARRVAVYAVPLPVMAFILVITARTPLWAADFTHSFLPAARLVWHGHSPYPALSAPPSGSAFVYPPMLALALLPLVALPSWLASTVFVLLVFAALVASLRALEIRDLRCYSVALLWPAVIATVQTASISLALTLAVALAWRWRDRPARQVAAVALGMVAKLFLWPLLVWVWAVHGWRRALSAAAASAGLALASWAAIGFTGLRTYPRVLTRLGAAEGPTGYTLSHLSEHAGLTAAFGTGLSYAAAVVLLALGWRTGRQGRADVSLALCIAAALVASPIVWLHYFALLLVPVGLASRTYSRLWLIPCAALLAGPAVGPNHRPGAVAAVLVAGVITTTVAARRLASANPVA
jgi:hypothetical protein